MYEEMITKQELMDAKEDARDLGDALNKKQIVVPRYGNPFNSLPLELDNLSKAIQVAFAAGAGGAGWTTSLVVNPEGKTQEQINIDQAQINSTQSDTNTKFNQKIVKSKSLDQWCAKMAAGEVVKIACFGDSTTDGDTTSSFTPNPIDVNGMAIGNSDHEGTAPKAYPAQLKSILQEMFGNANIKVFNAGYSGKRIDNGWAISNYDNAVTNNPYYGKPDICVIGFGLNDIAYSGFLERHIAQTILLVQKILDAGTLPILVSCNAVARSADNARSGAKASRQLDEAKQTVAKQFGIPFIDVGQAQKDWLESNTDGLRWTEVQPDSLHFGDIGHRYQAGFIAKELFRDMYLFKSGAKSLCMPTHDSRTNCKGIYSDYYQGANTRFLSNARFVTSDFVAGTAVATAWVWNESPNAELIYRGVANEGYDNTAITTPPKVKVTKKVTSIEKLFTPSNVGPCVGWFNSEKPYRVTRLNYGLNKIEYLIGNSVGAGRSSYMGYFELMETELGTEAYSNCLNNSGEVVVAIEPNKATSFILPEYSDGTNIYGCDVGEYVEFYIEATLAPYSGIIIGAASAYQGDTSPLSWGDKSYTYIYRGSEASTKLYLGRQGYYPGTDENATYTLWGDVNLSVITNNTKLVIRYSKTAADKVKIELWSAWDKSTGYTVFMVDHTTMAMCPMSGSAGGIFYESYARSGVSILHKLIKKVGKL